MSHISNLVMVSCAGVILAYLTAGTLLFKRER